MSHSWMPPLRQAAACAQRAVQAASVRLAVVVAIVAAVASPAHAAAPFEVRVTGTGPDVLLIPGLASSGAAWDDTLPAPGAVRMDSATPQQLHDFAPQMRAQLMAHDAAAYATGQAQQIARLVSAPADVARVQAWGRQSDRAVVIDAMTDMIGLDLRPQLSAVRAPSS